MRYSTTIDNVTSIKWGLNIQESYLFAFIIEANTWADKIIIDDELYFFLSRNKVVEDIPLLTGKPDTIYRFYKKFQELELIKYRKSGLKDCILLKEKSLQWNNYNQ